MDSYTTRNKQEAELLVSKGLTPTGQGGGWYVFPFDEAMQALGRDTGFIAHKALPVVLVDDVAQAWEYARQGGDYLGTTPGGAFIFRAREE